MAWAWVTKTAWAWHEHGMAWAWHGHGMSMAWAWHGHGMSMTLSVSRQKIAAMRSHTK